MSTATVSRALRGLPGVSEETRDRVRETARRLGYVPSPSAAGLASGQTRTVAVIVPFVTQWFFAAVVQGAEEELRERGYDLLLYNLAGDAAARHRVFETSLLTKRVDAVLVLSLKPSPDELASLETLDRPVTIVGADLPGWATVRIDDRARRAHRHPAPARPRPPPDRVRRRLDRGRPRLHRADRAGDRLPRHPGRGRACRTTRRSRRTASSPSPAAMRAAHDAARPAGAADRDLRGVRRDGDRGAARRPRARAPGAGGPVGDRHRRPRDGRLLRPHHGRAAGARAGPGRGPAGPRRPEQRRLEARAGGAADRADRPSYYCASRPAVRQVGDRPAGGEALALELGDRPLGPPLDDAARRAAARRRAPRPSARRSRPSRWPAATRHRAPAGSRPARTKSGVTSRRLWCFFLCQGSGKNVQSAARLPGSTRCSIDQTASTLSSRTLDRPASPTRPRVSATPGRQTSNARTSWSGRAAASATVDSPMPEPISTISGAVRPNMPASEKPGLVDRLVGEPPALGVRLPGLRAASG